MALPQARAIATDREVMDNYFDLLGKTMIECDLVGKPGQVFNMDERPKGIFEVGTQNAAAVNSGNKTQITVLACVNAVGYCLPPMVIFDREKFSLELANGKIQEVSMDFPRMDGLIKIFLRNGLTIIFCVMLLLPDHSSY